MEALVCHRDRIPACTDDFILLFYPLFFMSRFSLLDWVVLIGALLLIILYGLYKSRTTKNLDGYFRSNRTLPWLLVLLSIMGTQASAITFLSAPGQAYTDGMRFVQYYFGLPLAMVVICITFVPMFSKLNLYTAYEFLEKRFDIKTRTLTSSLFLIQRGLSTGISVYAPSIILSSLLGWDIFWTNIIMGGLLIIYTVSGGAKAVAYTQQLQFIIIFAGMFLAGYMVMRLLPAHVSFTDALQVSGKMGKLNVITTGVGKNGFDWQDRYNIWSGVIGGFFLALSYFGTDQSQVGRYLTAKNLRESRMGLLMNGLVKVPMQFFILLIGVLVFSFYQFHTAPLYFNDAVVKKLSQSSYKDSLAGMQQRYDALMQQKQVAVQYYSGLADAAKGAAGDSVVAVMNGLQKESDAIRTGLKAMIKRSGVTPEDSDTNYIFLRFVIDHLPAGLVGLLIAVIFLASWGSIAAALNSLASSTMVDFHKRFSNKGMTEEVEYRMSKWYTFGWGIFSIIVAQFAYNMGSLIEAVNILGSLFYGVILGIFVVALYLKKLKGDETFYAAIFAELAVLVIYFLKIVSFLWLNAIGCLLVIIFAYLLSLIRRSVENR
jgi:solute:Na+ symporter, SSS family